MRLFIPELGTLLTLSKDWTFTLYAESRNIDLWFTSEEKAENKKKAEEIQVLLDKEIAKQSKKEEKKGGWGYRMTPEIRRLSDLHRDYAYYSTQGKNQPKTKKITLPKGTVLAVDRIYIRKGNSEFSSVTFRIQQGKKQPRFWAKLEDVNTLEFNEVTKGKTFSDKYPNGRFTLQRYNGYGMYLSFTEPSGGMRSGRLGVRSSVTGGVVITPVQNNSFGKCNYYDSLEKAVAAAKRLGFPENLVNVFVKRYQDPKYKLNRSNLQEIKPGDKVATVKYSRQDKKVIHTLTVKTVEEYKKGNEVTHTVLSFEEPFPEERWHGAGPQEKGKEHLYWANDFINLNLE